MSRMDAYNIVWNKPSQNSSESMPVGGGDIGLNVWVEQGDVLLYLQRTGTFDENNQMLKLGRLRLTCSPNPFTEDGFIAQSLHLYESQIVIEGAHPDTGRVKIAVWVEVDRPVAHLEVEAEHAVQVRVRYESWRTAKREVVDRHACMALMNYPGQVFTHPDHMGERHDGVLFYHANQYEDLALHKEAKLQQLEAYKEQIADPAAHLIFGGLIRGSGFVYEGRENNVKSYQHTPYQCWLLRSVSAARRHDLQMYLHVAKAPDAEQWLEELDRKVCEDKYSWPIRRDRVWEEHQAWWRKFWSKGYVMIRPDACDESDPAWQIGRNYQLFRYMLGCNASGAFPTKFNGGLFTFDPGFVFKQLQEETPDFRRWGGGVFTAQNQRLVYWPMLKTGDFDMMPSQFDFYRNTLPAAELRTRIYWGHDGCCFTEQISNTGLPSSKQYGWQRDPHLDPGVEDNLWIKYEHVHQLDFAYMILEYYRYSGLDIADYMPFIESAVRFFDEHYQYRGKQLTGKPLDENGKLMIYPSTAAETFKDARNPTDVIAGLTAVASRLLELPDRLVPRENKTRWRGLLDRLPPIALEEKEGQQTIAPAESWSGVHNQEMPQLYPLFPFDLYGLFKPRHQLALNTWKYSWYHKDQKNYASWKQGGIFCARLGLTDEAKEYAINKLADGPYRFPAFWGPGFDWSPDHNWGGSGMIGLQDMLMQVDGRAIYLLPAWPADWDVSFKLYAPWETVIEGVFRLGKLEQLEVTPASRRADVVDCSIERSAGDVPAGRD